MGVQKKYRSNWRRVLCDVELAEALWPRVVSVVPAKRIETEETCPGSQFARRRGTWEAIGLNPVFRYARYTEGQHFSRHVDSFVYGRTENEPVSFFTVNIYLNARGKDFEGGRTLFYRSRLPRRRSRASRGVQPYGRIGSS